MKKITLIISLILLSTTIFSKEAPPAFNAMAPKTKRFAPKPSSTKLSSSKKTSSLNYQAERLPSWPGFARFPEKEDFLFGTLNAEFASWAYNSTGGIIDASSVVVGEDKIVVSDILLLSRLFKNKSVKDNTNAINADDLEEFHYLSKHLRDIDPTFDANSKNLELNLNYSRVFFKDICSLTLELPLLLRVNKIKMNRVFTPEESQALVTNAATDSALSWRDFLGKYPAGFSQFFDDLLVKKGMIADPQNVKVGLGDVAVCLNRRIESDHFEFGLVGCGVTMPTSRTPDKQYLWPSRLGNGGFWELRAHAGLYFRQWRLTNPYVFIDGRYRFLTSLDRRVSETIYGTTGKNLSLEQPFVDAVYEFVKDAEELESKIHALAQDIKRVEIRKGAQLKIRLGNVVDDAFLKNAHLDFYYEFMLKIEDALGFQHDKSAHDFQALMKNTDQNSHTAGCTYVYDYNPDRRLEVGSSFRFYGKNVLRVFELHGALQFDF
jgi:hypothetical protein